MYFTRLGTSNTRDEMVAVSLEESILFHPGRDLKPGANWPHTLWPHTDISPATGSLISFLCC